MTNLILAQQVNAGNGILPKAQDNGLDFNSTHRGGNHGSTSLLNADFSIRTERTPGAVAVSRLNGEEPEGETSPAALQQTQSRCGAWAVLAECESGLHHFAKRIVCGKEWCPVCGEHRSAAHNRRISRVLPKAMKIASMGYFVLEFPELYRHIGEQGIYPDPDIAGWCYSKKDLRSTTNIVVNVLAGKRMGRRGRVGGYFKRGLIRWHWFNDAKPGYRADKWNPHINVLVDAGYLSPELIEGIKTELRSELNCPDLIVHYSYFDKPGQMFQKVEYITRATFRNESWNPYMAGELFNFRNMRWWGNWKGEPVWTLKEVEAQGEDAAGLLAVSNLQSGVCPDCGQPLKTLYHSHNTGLPVQWTRPVDSTWLTIWNSAEIAGSGYYRIPHCEWNVGEYAPGVLLRLEQLEDMARGKSSVSIVVVLAHRHATRILVDREDEAWWGYLMEHEGEFAV